MTNNDLNNKLKKVFPELVVDKSLATKQEVRRMPRFVAEILLSMFCKEGVIEENLGKMEIFIRKHYPERKEKDIVLSTLMQFGEYKIIDDFKVETDIKDGTYKLIIPSLDIRNAKIHEHIILEHERLLIGGVWGVGSLEYDFNTKELVLVDFKPLQISSLNFDAFTEGRSEFTTEEWVDVLINTLGLNPNVYDFRTKLVLLSRMIPLVEPNTNLIELGPKGTGKTYLFRNVSYYSRVISGGQVTPATLFYHLVYNTPGLLALKDCVVFDEIATLKFANPEEIIGKLKDYMESGHYDRGPKQVPSHCSIMLVGNLPVRNGRPSKIMYFEVLPKIMQDTAFIDRLNGLIPGWELGRIQKSGVHLSQGLGFVTDFFCEVLHELRNFSYSGFIDQKVNFNDHVDMRDEKSIKKIASGLLKILFPNRMFNDNELKICLDLAIEYRQIIDDQLHIMAPGEFKKKKLGYEFI